MSRDYEYINVSKPRIRSPGLSHDLQLQRDLEIVNARTAAELGPLPTDGLPVLPKRKYVPPQSAAFSKHGQANFENQEDEAMKLGYVTAISAAITTASALAGCGEAGTVPSKVSSEVVDRAPAAEAPEAAVKDIPPGAHKLAAAKGDINSDGLQDEVLVVDYPGTGNEKLGEGLPRSLLLLVRDDSGALRKVAQNNKLVPCANCGGIWGDPFSSIRAENGSFTLVVEGGSRWHWSNEYTFFYDATRNDWFPKRIRNAVVDRLTTKGKEIELVDSEAPNISFSDFDPDTLPSVEM